MFAMPVIHGAPRDGTLAPQPVAGPVLFGHLLISNEESVSREKASFDYLGW
jgi:hypothetical protein